MFILLLFVPIYVMLAEILLMVGYDAGPDILSLMLPALAIPFVFDPSCIVVEADGIII